MKSTVSCSRLGLIRPPALAAPCRHNVLRRHVACQAEPSQIIECNAEELEVALQEREKPMIIDFYADWCGPCLLLAKTLKQVAEEFGDKIVIYKVNTDDNQSLASQLRIEGLPTMIFVGMDQSKVALRTEGILPIATIRDIIADELLAPPKA